MAKVARERLLGLAMPETTKQLLQKECDRDHKEWEISEEEVWEMASFHGAAYAQSSYDAAAAAAQAQKAIESSRRSNLLPRSGRSTSITSQRYVVASAPMKVPDAELAIRAGSTGTKQRAARSLILVGKKVGEGVFGKLQYVDDDDEDDDMLCKGKKGKGKAVRPSPTAKQKGR
eukprot:c14423_g3_i2 orf=107-628(-)